MRFKGDNLSITWSNVPARLGLAAFFARLYHHRYALIAACIPSMNNPTETQAHIMVGRTSEIIDSMFTAAPPQYPMLSEYRRLRLHRL